MTIIPIDTMPASTDIAGDDSGPSAGPSDEIEVLANLDDLASTDAMLGCGDDNPYQ
jgi:hypothetical protein